MQLNFSLAGLDRTYIRVHEDNKFAKEYNLMLGYRPTIHKGVYVLTKEVYNKRILKLRHIASLGKDLSPLSLDNIIINDFEKNHHIYKSLPKNLYLMAKK